jgi:hypothetical protein
MMLSPQSGAFGFMLAGTLGIFTQTCSKNVSGASRVFIAAKSVATAFAVSGNEITGVTGTTPFVKVDIIQDSLQWSEEGVLVGLNNWKITNKIEFDIMPPATATNTFLQALIDGSPCGLFAIVVDGNGSAWFVGHNETDVRERPLKLGGQKHDTGKGLGVAEGNTIHITLQNECGGLACKADSTLNSAIVTTCNSTVVKWT